MTKWLEGRRFTVTEAVRKEEGTALELSPDFNSLSSIYESMTLGKFFSLAASVVGRLSWLLSGLNEII